MQCELLGCDSASTYDYDGVEVALCPGCAADLGLLERLKYVEPQGLSAGKLASFINNNDHNKVTAFMKRYGVTNVVRNFEYGFFEVTFEDGGVQRYSDNHLRRTGHEPFIPVPEPKTVMK